MGKEPFFPCKSAVSSIFLMTLGDTAGHPKPAHSLPISGDAMKLTEANLPLIAADFAASGKADKIYFDDEMPGFGLRLRAGSKKQVWVFRYDYTGIQRKLTIGNAAHLASDQARKKAKQIMAKVILGGDPQAEKTEERAKARITLRHVAHQYLQRQAKKLRPKSLKEAQRYLLKDFRSLHPL
ncbi:MAG TPA: Arm DNA-binding domain-containing protein, partial [Xanthobacteraceae bacterium]